MTTSLPLRRLGRTDQKVTEIGLGGAALTHTLYGREHSEAESIETVHRALELGVTYIDTSPLYGDSERRIGLALEGVQRRSLFLATKTGTGIQPHNYSGEHTRMSVARSLERMKTDYIDLLQIHDPADLDQALAPGGALDVLLELKAQGVVRAIGLGVRTHSLLKQAIEHGTFDTILTFADFNLVRQTARETLFADAAAKDIGIIIGSPLHFGLLTNRPWDLLMADYSRKEADPDVVRARAVRDWCGANSIDITALALQFILREPRVRAVLTGAGSPAEIEENVSAVTNTLPDEVWRAVEDELGVK